MQDACKGASRWAAACHRVGTVRWREGGRHVQPQPERRRQRTHRCARNVRARSEAPGRIRGGAAPSRRSCFRHSATDRRDPTPRGRRRGARVPVAILRRISSPDVQAPPPAPRDAGPVASPRPRPARSMPGRRIRNAGKSHRAGELIPARFLNVGRAAPSESRLAAAAAPTSSPGEVDGVWSGRRLDWIDPQSGIAPTNSTPRSPGTAWQRSS